MAALSNHRQEDTMTHITHSPIRTIAIDTSLTGLLAKAARFAARPAVALGRALAGVSKMMFDAGSMAYVDPYTASRDEPCVRDEDGRDPRW
jgi:hypothetical protein